MLVKVLGESMDCLVVEGNFVKWAINEQVDSFSVMVIQLHDGQDSRILFKLLDVFCSQDICELPRHTILQQM